MERKWEKTRSLGNEETGKISSSLAVLVKQWQARSTTATKSAEFFRFRPADVQSATPFLQFIALNLVE
jgi:hypothetical protein